MGRFFTLEARQVSALALVLATSTTGCLAGGQAPTRILSTRAWTLPPAEPLAVEADDAAPDQPSSSEAPVETPSEPVVALAISASDARCPADMALVADRVCVDRWEASIVEHVAGAAERAWPPYVAIDGHEEGLRAVSRPGVLPQGYISGVQAKGMCRASGKRLCGAEDWQTACRGAADTQFPYGSTRSAKTCNDDVRAVHPVAEVGLLVGLEPQQWWTEGMNNPLINQLTAGLLPTGERSACTNDYGVFDMVGNLHEWVDDPDGTFRGGYYMDTTLNGDGCSYQTTAHSFDYHDYSTGFRCCLDADRVE